MAGKLTVDLAESTYNGNLPPGLYEQYYLPSTGISYARPPKLDLRLWDMNLL